MLPKYSNASEKDVDFPEGELNFIVQTNEISIYEIEENGEKLRYEESTIESEESTKIHTKVFNITGGESKLVDEFSTSLDFNDNEVKIEQERDFKVESEEITLSPSSDETMNFEKDDKQTLIFARASSSWVSSRMPKISIGYRYPDDAKYTGMYKYNVKLPNRDYDNFTRQVDSMRSRETSILMEGTGLAAAGTLAKLVSGKLTLSWSTAWSLIKKVGAPLAVGYDAFRWFQVYDKAVKYFYATPPKTKPGTIPR
ncbi:hypothetical protein QTG56_00655 [Rossellomorea sp. AcN35-11]|nr:hypothetical protein [Rossellomorea aquimaris]WJV29717.1 hypothetical protein QTG56_00655 [Rossellomorea sp. AcN35-11]